ncbi:MAG: biopolymer transporter ExbD [Gammaproteobacteria bacterium]|nr:biopolymer transporter ExbD [Gammaproteobacteria bacterium]
MERRRRRPIIGLTPLIDVVFILLIFFMLASSFLDWRAIPLEVPRAGLEPSSEVPGILVRIARGGEIDLNGIPVTSGGLARQLARLLQSSPNVRVLVQPQAGVPLQQVVRVLDDLSGAGARHVSLVRR